MEAESETRKICFTPDNIGNSDFIKCSLLTLLAI